MKLTRRQLRNFIITEAKEAKGATILQKIADGAEIEKSEASLLQKSVDKKLGKGFNLSNLRNGAKIVSTIRKIFKALRKSDNDEDLLKRAASELANAGLEIPIERLLALISFGSIPLNFLIGKARKKLEKKIRLFRGELWMRLNKPGIYAAIQTATRDRRRAEKIEETRSAQMKITRRQLRRLINEAILLESAAEVLHPGSYKGNTLPLGKNRVKYALTTKVGKITNIKITKDHSISVTGELDLKLTKVKKTKSIPKEMLSKYVPTIKEKVSAGAQKFSITHEGDKLTFTRV